MTISFDIDNTLIPYGDEFPVEHQTWRHKVLGAEALRAGTKRLFQQLARRGHTLLIYTTSYRSTSALRRTFYAHGLRPMRYIAGKENAKTLADHQCTSSKNPRLFGIDVHVDDSIGVQREGEKHGFATIIVAPQDTNWVNAVLQAVVTLEEQQPRK